MKKIITYCSVLLLTFGFSINTQAQNKEELIYVGEVGEMHIAPSIASISNPILAVKKTEEPKDGRYTKGVSAEVIPNKDPQTEDDYFIRNRHRLDQKIANRRALELDFEVGNNVNSPSDPALAVGPDHVFIVYNTGFIIYDKDGNDLTGALAPNNIFSDNGCCDLTASYDNAAQRWVIALLGNGVEVAVSDGPNPITSNWFVYSLPQVSDYNKLSVWRDGYYITDNGSTDVWVLDRTAALAGNPTANIQGFTIPGVEGQGFTSAQVFNVTDDNLPTTGGAPLVYMRDDGFASANTDQINIWTVNVDFANPANSNVSAPEEFPVTPFINVFDGGSFVNLTQPGGGSDIDALQSTIMNQAQFRKFPSHNSAIFNFVVDTDAGPGELAGIRWYEFRQSGDGMPWIMHQEGTFTAPDGKHAWMGSMAMDEQGNIGLGYTSMAGPTTANPTAFPVGMYYTGRFANDPLGTMTIAEEVVQIGPGNIQGFRYGDYAKIDVDPTNGKEFWFITEYLNANHVAKFQIASDFQNDVGVINLDSPMDGTLSATEDITVTIFNFGTEDATNFNVTYQIDGGPLVSEVFTGTIPGGGNSAQFTFAQQADLSIEGQAYSITTTTDYTLDEDNANDAITTIVNHLNGLDTGVTALENPSSGQLTATEAITVEITNFGAMTQTSIPVFYTVNGGAPVQEMYTGSIASGATDTHTFIVTEDLSAIGDYEIVTGTELVNDAVGANDNITITVTNFICMPETDCSSFGDGVTILQLADQDITTDCDGTSIGYTDNSDIIFNFVLSENPFVGNLQVGWDGTTYAIFIDFNEDNTFDEDEIVSENTVQFEDTDFAFTIDFLTIPNVTSGMYKMRVRAVDESADGDASDPCGEASFGRTNDYTANISGTLGIDDADFGKTELEIYYLPNSQYEVVFNNTLSYINRLPITVYNGLGQKLAYYTVENTGNSYRKTIDMSYAQSGVYFVRIGDATLNKTKRIIVK